jgi:energy-coupling factor transporter ATP-binding protein EcfA2
MRTDPRGSVWRRWDLHLHTPASFDYRNHKVTPQDLVDALVTAGVEVAAVTDHHTIDVDLISTMQQLAGDRLTVLPGIELRSELGGSEYVHYTGIFPEHCNLKDLWIKLQSLGISEADVKAKGDEQVWVAFSQGCAEIRKQGGIVVVHAGKKSNSIEQLTNADAIKRAVKADLAREHLHALEVGRPADCCGYRDVVFPYIDKELPLLICSDNHNIAEYSTRCTMWVKGDPNFASLLRLLNEPSERIYLGDAPPLFAEAKARATKYIDAVVFERTPEAKDEEQWFSGYVPLNHGLIAIIGNKGSGKSALADIVALLANAHTAEDFSFLNSERFLSPRSGLGCMFRARIEWHSGSITTRCLDEPIDPIAPELVKYIPQNYLERICSELKESNDTQFDRELSEVIFSRIPDTDRLGKDSLRELVAYLTDERERRIEQVSADLARVDGLIVSLEEKLTDEHRQSLTSRLQKRLLELKTHESAIPDPIEEPQQNPEAQTAMAAVTAELLVLQKSLGDLQAKLQQEGTKREYAARQVAAADRLLARMDNLKRTVEAFYGDSVDDVATLELDSRVLVRYKIDRDPVVEARAEALARLQAATALLDPQVEGSIAEQCDALTLAVETKRQELDEPNRRYQEYKQQLGRWQQERNRIAGTADDPESIAGLQARIAALDGLPSQLAAQKVVRKGFVKEIWDSKESLITQYRKLYEPVQQFIDHHPVSRKTGALQFHAAMNVGTFIDDFLRMIHMGRKGSFQGDDEGRERLRQIVLGSDLNTEAGVLAFLATVQDHLEHDKRDGISRAIRVKDQLRQHVSLQEFYDYLYGLEYLKPRFELRWQDKPLDQLSPGERGNLLLVFYLLIDKRDCPLMIDQPEENLDNQTVASMLVPAIRDAKQRRQIILVTHNPNLAVVCDAEQVIHAAIDKTRGSQVVYTSGAIENPIITQLIVDVLEGTKPAFDLRDATYDILERPT